MKNLIMIFAFCGVLMADGELKIAMNAIDRGDFETAVSCFTILAQRGDFIGQQNLGVMYNNGFGVPQNRETAAYWFNKSVQTRQAREENAGLMVNEEMHFVQNMTSIPVAQVQQCQTTATACSNNCTSDCVH